VEAYLESSYSTLSDRWGALRRAEAAWVAVRYPALLADAREGVRAVRRLVTRSSSALEALWDDDAPPRIGEIRDEIDRVTSRLRDVGLGRADDLWNILSVDAELRGPLREDLESFLDRLAELDALTAAARLLDEGYTLPEMLNRGHARLEGKAMWHPFLPGGVANPISLGGGGTLVFLTGPNMAGKTTYLRTVGICVYLAHCGLPVPARSFACSPVDRLVTGLSPEDSLRDGVSFFLAEVRRVKEVVEAVASGERTVAIFDEVFRGTNVTDALEASRTVLEGCSADRMGNFVFASHLVELAEELEDLQSVQFAYFDGELEDERLRFDYRVRPGVSHQRFGMTLLRREGVPELLASIVEQRDADIPPPERRR